jgi:hypothetical protein
MTVRKAPGKHLIATLNRSLKEGTEWTEAERVTLDLIEEAADTVAVLKTLFDAETGGPQVPTRDVTELAAEIRQHEANIHRWVATLDPDMTQVKSARHQPANVRWHGSA